MVQLHHFVLDPFSRRVRLALAEKGETVELIDERPWAPSARLIDLNPTGLTPVLIEDSGRSIAGVEALSEFLEEKLQGKSLLPGKVYERAEVRRLVAWFDVKFFAEVTEPLLGEKVVKRFMKNASAPDMPRVRAALQRLKPHLEYLSFLAEERAWLAGPELSLADLAAASHLSVLDYLGDVNWADNPVAKAWYQRIKSRPSFRILLADSFPALPPSAHYADLDF